MIRYQHKVISPKGYFCICFTAYTILLEMERMLRHAKSKITIKRAQELTKTMYQLKYRLPKLEKISYKKKNSLNCFII